MSDGPDGVASASRCTMKDHLAAPNYVAQSFMSRREMPLDNTFINLCVQDQQLMRRSKSVPCCVEAPVEAPDVDACHNEKFQAPSDFTTLIISNLPVNADKACIQAGLRDIGFHGSYNFLHVPARFKDGSCRGYCFINFVTHRTALKFKGKWQGHRMFCGPWHRKPLAVDVAAVQGVDALMMKSGGNVRNPKFRPYIARR
mmetsp:Transcript_57637/g.134907  ORF Transcript_57637/g.134907 Transcript_57637/m.134907 type:complete len:200 (+) Transcript_57637:82-681(+)